MKKIVKCEAAEKLESVATKRSGEKSGRYGSGIRVNMTTRRKRRVHHADITRTY